MSEKQWKRALTRCVGVAMVAFGAAVFLFTVDKAPIACGLVIGWGLMIAKEGQFLP